MKTGSAAAKAGRCEWTGLAVMALPCMLYSMDLTVLNLAVPSLSASLKPTSAQLLWIVDIYGFMLAGALMTKGAAGPLNAELVLAARAAFTHAMVRVAVVTAAIALSTAVAAAVFLRHVGVRGERDHLPERDAEAPPMTLVGQPVPIAK